MRLLTSLSFQLLFVSFFLAIVTGTIAKEMGTDHSQAIDGQVGGAGSKLPTIELPVNKGFWHDILYGGKTHYVSHKAITVAKNITQATDGVAVSKFPTIRLPQGRDVRTVALDKRAATKDATQAIDGEGAGKLPTIQPNQGKGFWHDIMWWNTWNNIHKVSKRGATVTKYVTRTVTSFPTVTVRKTDTVYMTKIKTRTISVNGKAITTSDSKAVLESGGLMVPRPRYSGSVFAGAALAVVMVVYA